MNHSNGDTLFEWDSEKSRRNEAIHGVTFSEAASVFYDYLSITVFDAQHSTLEEQRFITIGESAQMNILIVVHCDRGDKIRIVSARKANRIEKRKYEEGNGSGRNR
jgi:hypothetical protein